MTAGQLKVAARSPSRINFISLDRCGILDGMMKLSVTLLFVVAALSGCATQNFSRGGTLLSGLNQYHGDMRSLTSESRWPERQRAAGSLKTIITGTVGASPEFYRLIDLDLRKREFTVTLRDTNVRPDRKREMEEELIAIDEEIAALKPVVKTQLSVVSNHEPGDRIENAATLGLLGLAVDNFSSTGGSRSGEAPSTRVGPYLVTDLGAFSTVRTPEGQSYRCNVFSVPEEGGGMRCEPVP